MLQKNGNGSMFFHQQRYPGIPGAGNTAVIMQAKTLYKKRFAMPPDLSVFQSQSARIPSGIVSQLIFLRQDMTSGQFRIFRAIKMFQQR